MDLISGSLLMISLKQAFTKIDIIVVEANDVKVVADMY